MLIDLGIGTKVIGICVRLNSIFSDTFRDNEGNNAMLSMIKKVVYNNSEGIYILSRTGEFDNSINKSYYNIT